MNLDACATDAARLVLAHYIGTTPDAVPLVTAPGGKPGVASHGARSWHFSASRSRDRCVVAVASHGPIGVDLEYAGAPLPGIDRTASRYFAPAEARMICALPEPQRTEVAMSCWTRKEALLKATGEGVTDSSLRRLIQGEGTEWRVVPLPIALPFAGAVAVRADDAVGDVRVHVMTSVWPT